VRREGDPKIGVAVALVHDAGAHASRALSTLLAARLRAQGFSGLRAQPNALGLELSAFAESADEVGRLIGAAAEALRAPVRAEQPEVALALTELAAPLPEASTHAAAVVAECSAELMATGAAPSATPETLESMRERAVSAEDVAFAVVGPDAAAASASAALLATGSWPSGSNARDPWPTEDVFGAHGSPGTLGELSVAVRGASAGAAIAAARALGRPGSTLDVRLRALDPSFTVQSVSAVARPRGACLRAELSATLAADEASQREAARAALVALSELERAVARPGDAAWHLQQGVLLAPDPRTAAAAAAWSSLAGTQKPGPVVRFVSGALPGAEHQAMPFADRVRAMGAQFAAQRLPSSVRVERGQARLSLLLASPCGTAGEAVSDAGLTALALRTLARRSYNGVVLEPWITADGAGILAHAPPLGPEEPPLAHADRVASALGRALAGPDVSGRELGVERARLLEQLGSPRPGLWLTIEGMAPGHPSWLQPLGTFQAVSELTTRAVRARARTWLSEPLKVSILAPHSEAQGEAASRALERWLAPLREDGASCVASPAAIPHSGQRTLGSTQAADAGVAYVSIPLPPHAHGPSAPAAATAYLLNRESGWLDQALRAPGLASSGRAFVLSSRRAATLVIEVRAPGRDATAAVAQVRGLLQNLAQGAATAADAKLASAALRESSELARLSPERRVAELWVAERARSSVSVAELHRLHQTFLPQSHLVIYSLPLRPSPVDAPLP
jgi:hypothetical protein